jgi:hypothetical protein
MEFIALALMAIQTVASLIALRRNRIAEQSSKGEAMATVLKVRSGMETNEVRVSEDPEEVNNTLAVANREGHPFVVFTNADSNKQESFKPNLVQSFAAE